MDIAQLRYFLKIAELRNFTRAAEACFISQPAISQQIARLEEELGVPVFERSGRKVRLTAAGELLSHHATRIVGLVEDAKSRISDDGETGVVTVSAIPTIAPYFLPAVLEAFGEAHPRAQVEVGEDVTEVLLRRCAHGEVDVGVLALPVDAPGLEIETLLREELKLMLPDGHALAERRRLRLADLGAEPFVMLGEVHCLSDQIRSFCTQRSMVPIVTSGVSQLTMVQELVALGHGVSFLPEMAARLDPGEGRTYRSLDGPRPYREVAMCTNPSRFRTRLVSRFIEFLRARAGGSSVRARRARK